MLCVSIIASGRLSLPTPMGKEREEYVFTFLDLTIIKYHNGHMGLLQDIIEVIVY